MALCCAAAFGACASKPLRDPSADDPASPDDFLAAFAKGVCGALGRCCGVQSFAFDAPACEQSLTTELGPELHQDDGLRVDFDPAAAAACIDDFETAACPDMPAVNLDVKRNCARLFRGRVAAGQPCVANDECFAEAPSYAYCDLDNTQRCVTVAPEPHGQASAACGGTCRKSPYGDDGCASLFVGPDEILDDDTLPRCFTAEGLQCAGNPGGARTCQTLVAVGQSCAGNAAACIDGAFCNFATNLCEAQSSDGPCTISSDACALDAICDDASARCVLSNEVDGSACTKNDDCESDYCNPSAVCQTPLTAADCAGPIEIH